MKISKLFQISNLKNFINYGTVSCRQFYGHKGYSILIASKINLTLHHTISTIQSLRLF